MAPSAMAAPDVASDTPEARTISRTKNAARRVERVVMRSPLLPNDRTRSSRKISELIMPWFSASVHENGLQISRKKIIHD
jgi:hypothetical protein